MPGLRGAWCRRKTILAKFTNLLLKPVSGSGALNVHLDGEDKALVERYRAYVLKARRYKDDYYERILKR